VTTALLSLPRLGNTYLSHSAYSILSDLLTLPNEDDESDISSQIPSILKAVLTSLPSKADATLAPAWLSVLGNTLTAYHRHDAGVAVGEVGKVWKIIWTFLDNGDSNVRRAAAQALGAVSSCFTPELIDAASKERKSKATADPKSVIGRITSQVCEALDELSFARAMPDLLSVITFLLSGLRREPPGLGATAAQILLLPAIEQVAHLRVEKGFEFKEAADGTLSAAMSVLGAAVLLEALPLNIEPADRQAGKEPRAFLLPLLAQPHSSPLEHFVSYFVPLSERMFDYQSEAESGSRPAEAKLWSVLLAQIWAGLAGYTAGGCVDLPQVLTPEFAQLLTQLLYGQPELRSSVLKALKGLVDANVAIASGDEEKLAKMSPSARAVAVSRKQAQKNLAFLRTQAESWLAVLFNVFGSVDRDVRGVVGDVISAWAGITGESVCEVKALYDGPLYPHFRILPKRIKMSLHCFSKTSHLHMPLALRDRAALPQLHRTYCSFSFLIYLLMMRQRSSMFAWPQTSCVHRTTAYKRGVISSWLALSNEV
jgi:ribosomal RNA-processing protein 12